MSTPPPASIEQVEPAYAWWLRQRVMYPEKSLDGNKLPDDLDGIHLGLFASNQLTSIVSLFWREDSAQPGTKSLQFRKFCTLTEAQGNGYGTQLLHYVLDYARTQGATLVFANARLTALPFYARFGFQSVGDVWQQDGHGFVRIELPLAV